MTTTGNRTAPAVDLDGRAEGHAGAGVPGPAGLAEVAELAHRIAGNVAHVLVGKPDVVRIALVALLAEGHLLVEDVPGVGKTSLAKALARSIDCSVSRVQFTPDLLPGDITGVSIFNRQTEEFEFRPGPGVRQRRDRRRDQPRVAEDPVGAAGVHGRAPGHRRRRHLRPGQPVPRGRDPEPGRDGRHLPAARGPARPVHRAGQHRLPRSRRRADHARRARRGRAARAAAPGGRRRGGAGGDRGGAARPASGRRSGSTASTS